MTTWARHIWEALSSSYWFVPAIMIALSVLLAIGAIQIDRAWQPELSVIYSGGADGARTLLSIIAGSVITVAGVVFSITIATLTQASSQFGPRLLRNFMRDRGNQIVLGMFTATFVYCILIVRTIRSRESGEFVPELAVTLAVALALMSIGVLIYFIHHISRSLQAPVIAATAATEFRAAVNTIFQDPQQHRPQIECEWQDPDAPAAPVHSIRAGYVQAIDDEGLIQVASDHDAKIRLHVRPGDFVIARTPIASIWSQNQDVQDIVQRTVKSVIIGNEPTAEQDVEFAILQLVEIAGRALSSGINDPFTAIECIDWLADGLCVAARRAEPSPFCCDDRGVVRLARRTWTFEGMVNAAFNPLRQFAASSVPCLMRMLERIADLAKCCRHDEHRMLLHNHVKAIQFQWQNLELAEIDRMDLENRHAKAVQAIHTSCASDSVEDGK